MDAEKLLTIYIEGVVAEMLVSGDEDLKANRAFLSSLVGQEMALAAASFPIGDPGHDFYSLTKSQWQSFQEFRQGRRVAAKA